MTNKLFSIEHKFIRSFLFVWLLPVFFVLHGVAQNVSFIPLQDIVVLLFKYWISEIILAGIFYIFFRDIKKALYSVFVTFFLFLFFGAIEDFFKSILANTLFDRYRFLFPVILVLWLTSLYLIRRKALGKRISLYLNVVFLILITIDLTQIAIGSIFRKPIEKTIANCPTCDKPDVYLLVFDEYAGNNQLKKCFGYDNTAFLDTLRNRGFWVMDSSTSNYDKTPFSISSMLNMQYHSLKDYEYSGKNMNYCYKLIARNPVVDVFEKQGYEFLNFSVFNFNKHPSFVNKTFLVSGIDLITSQTLWGRFKREVFNNLLRNWLPGSKMYKDFVLSDLKNNEAILEKTLLSVKEKRNKPKFCYAHFMMPHFPYYYDSSGIFNGMSLLEPKYMYDEDLYLSYLKYANKKILSIIDYILKYSNKPPVILLLSDHGYRYISRKDEAIFKYSNLAAIFLPNRKYDAYYPTISNVNQMRILLNTLFHLNYPLLEDKQVVK